MLHITFSKYDCIIVHKAYYLFTCTCVSINSFHSHSHSHITVTVRPFIHITKQQYMYINFYQTRVSRSVKHVHINLIAKHSKLHYQYYQ